jgi:predicted ATPase
MLLLREEIRGWRFYDQLRTDAAAPARMPQIGTYTPVLGHDGADSGVRRCRPSSKSATALRWPSRSPTRFPGRALRSRAATAWFEVEMQQHGLLRALKAAELSDGTLRYLLWIAALLTPRPPELLVLNEPETSLHPDLLPRWRGSSARASAEAQVIVVSHAEPLIDALRQHPECQSIVLEKTLGETRVADADDLTRPSWQLAGTVDHRHGWRRRFTQSSLR